MTQSQGSDFNFGLELEYLLIDKASGRALWWEDLKFSELNNCFEKIPLAGIPSLAGLELEAPAKVNLPFIVEGYHVPDENFQMVDILPKGVEIRTPVTQSLQDCLQVSKNLFDRMKSGLEGIGYLPVALSHHPTYSEFKGQQNKRRHDYWQWAMEVMTTYGPDINISLPWDYMRNIDLKDLEAKVNYYSPAMAAFSVASPFLNNELWKIRNRIGKSFRSYKRSYIAPPIEIHPDEGFRLEFKVFEMSPSLQDYQNYFLIFLALLLGEGLQGRASKQSYIYDMGSVAQFGFEAPEVRSRAAELLQVASKVLSSWGFQYASLKDFEGRLENTVTPADALIRKFQAGQDLATILKSRAVLD